MTLSFWLPWSIRNWQCLVQQSAASRLRVSVGGSKHRQPEATVATSPLICALPWTPSQDANVAPEITSASEHHCSARPDVHKWPMSPGPSVPICLRSPPALPAAAAWTTFGSLGRVHSPPWGWNTLQLPFVSLAPTHLSTLSKCHFLREVLSDHLPKEVCVS